MQGFVLLILIIAVLGAGCAPSPFVEPTATLPPTETPVPLTPIPAFLGASLDDFWVDGFAMKIVYVHLGKDDHSRFAPFQLGAGETYLTIRVQPLSRLLSNLSDEDRELFQVWVSDEYGRIARLGPVVTSTSTDYLFQFPVLLTSEVFYLHFPNGDIFDLTPLLP